MKFRFKSYVNNWNSVNLFPLAEQLKGYSKESFLCDMRSGFNVAVLSFPVNMAYALVAGLPLSYGIFGGIAASIIGLIFCNSVYLTFGPSNASAVMLLSAFAAGSLTSEAAKVAALPNILLMVAAMMVLISVFKLTFVISYISRTVIIGYVTASALLIVANQMGNMFGFSYPEGSDPITLIDTVNVTIASLGGTKASSVTMLLLTIFIFVPLKRYAKKLPAEGISLILVGVISYVAIEYFGAKIDCLSKISVSSWQLTTPDFSVLGIKESANFALAITILVVIEAFSIGKSLAAQRADRLDTNQQMFALGISNAACALSSSTLASGSMTRSTLAVNSGAKTTVFNLFTAIFTIIATLLFGSAISYVPKATLALVVVYTSITLIKPAVIKVALKSTHSDAIVFLITFLSGVIFTLDISIYAGIIASILLFLKKASAPEVVEYAIGDNGELDPIKQHNDSNTPEISIVHVEGNMFFGASDVVQNQLRRIAADPNLKILIIKLRNAINIDATSVLDIEELASRMKESGRRLILCEARQDVMRVFRNSGGLQLIGAENIFENDETNPTLSAARAIKFARSIIGDKNIRLTIYANKKL